MGEGAFSDEIRSRGRSEFGYLIREREKRGRGRGGMRARTRKCVRRSVSIFLSPFSSLSPCQQPPGCKWDYADPALQTALYSSHHLSPPPTSGWDELTIDRIDTVAVGRGPRVRRLETRVLPAAVVSIFPAKLHPSPSVFPLLFSLSFSLGARIANAYAVKPFFPLRDCYGEKEEEGNCRIFFFFTRF